MLILSVFFVRFPQKLLFVTLLLRSVMVFSQAADSTKKVSHFSGAISATHNGISLIPTFSLEKPALIFNLSIGGKKHTFEPDMRFALEGKPWSFLFWWRYKAIQSNRFSLRVGAHPALNFRTVSVNTDGKTRVLSEARRFMAAEFVPNYRLTKNIQVGMYYLRGHGFDDGLKNSNFLVLNSSFNNIPLTKKLYAGFYPNVYYLKLDNQDGFFYSATARLAKKNFPISLESIINKRIKSDISGSKNFVWNVSLVYSFNREYVPFKPQI